LQPKPTSTASAQNLASATKRKADAEFGSTSVKTQRNDADSKTIRSSTSTSSSSGFPQANSAIRSEFAKATAVDAAKVKDNLKSAGSSSTMSNEQRSTKAVAPKVAAVPPPKGSFRDIMGRAKATHEKDKFKMQTPIQHKDTPVLSLTELRAQKAARKNKKRAANSDVRRSHSVSDNEIAQEKAARRAAKRKEGKAAIRAKAKALMLENRKRGTEKQSTYKGTMRGPTTTYKGTMNLKPAARDDNAGGKSAALGSGKSRSSRHDTYESTTSEDEDAVSDASSDMEADVFDVDKEEQRALKAARMEDAEALKEENDLKRKKMERKRALEALKASRAKNAA
jgi:hypothetical protein